MGIGFESGREEPFPEFSVVHIHFLTINFPGNEVICWVAVSTDIEAKLYDSEE